jgi:hypothetical protein
MHITVRPATRIRSAVLLFSSPWFAALFAVAWRGLFLANRGLAQGPAYFFDDALITLRYTANLAAGHGLVYNPGEAVLGTTTPLYALLMAPAALLGLALPWTAAIFNLLIDACIVFAFVRIGSGRPVFQFLAPAFYVLHPDILYFSANGMEMSLIVALALLMNSLFWRGRQVAAGIVAAALVMGRIDGVLFIVAVGVLAVAAQRRIPWRFALAALVAYTPWALITTLFYGSPIPASALAKRIWMAGTDRFFVLDIHYSDERLLPLALVGLVAVVAWRRREDGPGLLPIVRSLVVWMAVFSAFFIVLGSRIESWYRVPQHVTFVLLAALGGEAVWRQLPRIHHRAPRAVAATLAAWVLVTVAVPDLRGPWQRLYLTPLMPMEQEPVTTMHVRVGRWLREHAGGGTAMAGNIGHIGWQYRGPILDDVGLVSPTVLPLLNPETRDRSPLIAAFRPEFLALERREVDEMQTAIAEAGYVQVATFPYAPDPQHGSSPYRIYARPDAAAGLPSRTVVGTR